MKENMVMSVNARIEKAIENDEKFCVVFDSPELTINELAFSPEEIWSFDPNEICFVSEKCGYSFYITLSRLYYDEDEDWIVTPEENSNKISISFFK